MVRMECDVSRNQCKIFPWFRPCGLHPDIAGMNYSPGVLANGLSWR